MKETKNRLVVPYNVELKYITYALLEFYNSMDFDKNPEYYDEKFMRILFTSFIGAGKVDQFINADPENMTILLIKGTGNI